MKLTVKLETPSGDVVLSSPEIPDSDDEARLQAAAYYFDVLGPRLLTLLEVQREVPAPDAEPAEDPTLPTLAEPAETDQ